MASCLPSGNYSWLDSAQSENEPENLTSSSILLQSAKQKIKYRCESWELPNLNALSLGLHLGSQWVAQASSSHRIQPRCDEPPSRPVWFCQLGQLHADDDHYFRCHGWLPSSNQTWRQLPLLGILASSIKSIWLIMAGWFFHCQVWFLEVAASRFGQLQHQTSPFVVYECLWFWVISTVSNLGPGPCRRLVQTDPGLRQVASWHQKHRKSEMNDPPNCSLS